MLPCSVSAFKDDTDDWRLNLAQRSNVVPVGLSKAFGSVCYNNICADCEISREKARLANAF